MVFPGVFPLCWLRFGCDSYPKFLFGWKGSSHKVYRNFYMTRCSECWHYDKVLKDMAPRYEAAYEDSGLAISSLRQNSPGSNILQIFNRND